MTSPEPDLRPTTCTEVAEALRDIERDQDLPVTGPTPTFGTSEPGRRTAGRHRHRYRRRRVRVRRPRRRSVVLTGAALLAVSAAVSLSALAGRATPAPSPTDATVLPSAVAQPILSEDFDDRRLDPTRWLAPSQQTHVYARDRALHLIGTTGSETVDTGLRARDVGEFREVDFVTGAVSAGTPGPGGASVVVTERGGRTHKIVFGPSPGERTLVAAALVCRRASCASYDDYVPPPRTRAFERYSVGDQVPMRILSNGKELTFWMRDTLMATTPISQPLVGFAVDGYAEAPERWHLTVDAIRAYR